MKVMMNKAMLARSWLRERKFQGNKLVNIPVIPRKSGYIKARGVKCQLQIGWIGKKN